MSLLAMLMGAVITWTTVLYGNQPIDEWIVIETTETIEQPLYEWFASWYDYKLWGKWRSKEHDTCALRIYERYQTYKVCVDENCITCYHNDYGPQREDRVIDLSSHAFKQLAPLSKWLVYVKVYPLTD